MHMLRPAGQCTCGLAEYQPPHRHQPITHLVFLVLLCRAIVDEVLPPAFLASTLPSLPDGSLGVTVVQATGAPTFAKLHICHITWPGVNAEQPALEPEAYAG